MTELEALFEATTSATRPGSGASPASIALLVFFALLLLRRLVRSHYKRLLATPQSGVHRTAAAGRQPHDGAVHS